VRHCPADLSRRTGCPVLVCSCPIPEGIRVVATITANNGNGTSQATLRDGSVITVKGESVGIGKE
ncbi:hypothetical protein, partial [Endozoicomonas sp.]|uniref:hypothetical protein n=1 Tax=Endozoicomonas sp. TaxID=1892382 RepID=UPI00383B43D5